MRAILNAVLSFIGAESLTDEEWETVSEFEDESDLREQYDKLRSVLGEREAVSTMYKKLAYYFKAKGLTFPSSDDDEPIAKTNIFVGSVLE